MKIAVVGAGVSGLVAAYLLDQKYNVTVFEAEDYIGGHTHTVPVTENGKTIWIDTGFIVCNPKNYPNFFKLLEILNVPLQKSTMSFSVSTKNHALEYNGTSFNGLFAQRRNLLNFKFWGLLQDIIKFNAAAKDFVKQNQAASTWSLGKFVATLQLSKYFSEYYLIPIVSAIWSSAQSAALDAPAFFICRFLENHGMLNINDRPQWYTVQGGSHEYVKALVAKLQQPVRINTPVSKIVRSAKGVEIHTAQGIEHFDKVIIATHSDQALKIIEQPVVRELQLLSSMRYQNNEVILHTDISLLPQAKRAWASWNYKLSAEQQTSACVTYNMNILQSLQTNQTYCVSLNQSTQIASDKIIARFNYAHPIYDLPSMLSQQAWHEINGLNNTYYCGAYWGNGFHEDGVNSALRVVSLLDKELLCAAQFSLVE